MRERSSHLARFRQRYINASIRLALYNQKTTPINMNALVSSTRYPDTWATQAVAEIVLSFYKFYYLHVERFAKIFLIVYYSARELERSFKISK